MRIGGSFVFNFLDLHRLRGGVFYLLNILFMKKFIFYNSATFFWRFFQFGCLINFY